MEGGELGRTAESAIALLVELADGHVAVCSFLPEQANARLSPIATRMGLRVGDSRRWQIEGLCSVGS